MTVEPMTDAELAAFRAETTRRRTPHHSMVNVLIGDMGRLFARLDAERTRADAAEAARDAALARAMPEPKLMRTVEEVEALPDGDYIVRLRPPVHRQIIWTHEMSSLGFRWWRSTIGREPAVQADRLIGAWTSGPLPDLPIPPTED